MALPSRASFADVLVTREATAVQLDPKQHLKRPSQQHAAPKPHSLKIWCEEHASAQAAPESLPAARLQRTSTYGIPISRNSFLQSSTCVFVTLTVRLLARSIAS